MSELLTREHNDPQATVLTLTNMWPNDDRPDYGIFVKRQVDSLIAAGIRTDVLFIRGYRSRRAYPAAIAGVAALNRDRRYAMVHAHGGETALAARMYVRGPVLVSYCGDDLLGTPSAGGNVPLTSRLRRAVLQAHSRTITATITKSKEMEATLPGSKRARNLVLPNGVDISTFSPMPRQQARQLLGWSDDERVALFAGDPAIERKRHWLASAAAEVASERGRPVRLHVATGIAPEEMPVLMNAADCLILTSSIEGSPNVVKEALMCNLPVVATDVGDVRELLANVNPSWVCDSTPKALGSALATCLRHPVRTNGRDASKHLAAPEIAKRLVELYANLAPATVTHLTRGG